MLLVLYVPQTASRSTTAPQQMASKKLCAHKCNRCYHRNTDGACYMDMHRNLFREITALLAASTSWP